MHRSFHFFPRSYQLHIAFLALTLIGILLGASLTAKASSLYQLAYWQLDENAAPFADSFNNHDGMCVNCPTAVSSGLAGQAQNFAANALTTITVSNSADFDWSASDNFSVELWVKAEPGITCAAASEVMVGRGTPGSGHWAIGCDIATGQARFELSDSSGSSVTLLSNHVITNGRWHHIIAGRDGDNGQNFLHVDAVDSKTITAAYEAGPLISTTADITIGSINGSRSFTGQIDEVAIYGGTLPQSERYTHYYLSRAYTESCSTAVAIMPLGDSITQGSNSGVTDETKMISYRKVLWDSLNSGNYNVDFVGSRDQGQFYVGFDSNHEGWPGYTSAQVDTKISLWLEGNPPDVILLHIGTNGLTIDTASVESILDKIDAYDETITVVLARIINRVTYSSNTTTYNNNLASLAQTRINNGDKIVVVDMENGAGIVYALQSNGGEMYDNLHPFASGYAKMAAVWDNTLQTFLPTCAIGSPVIGAIADQASLAGMLFQYQVMATGNPSPTFSLLDSPNGMTINSNSGLITWTPTTNQAGSHNVTIQASNSQGSDTESFMIDVLSAGLAVTLSPDSQKIGGGDTAVFTATITNTGNVTLSLVVEDLQSPDCELAISLATLAPAENLNYTCTATNILQDFTNNLTATGMYTPTTGSPISVVASDTAFVDVGPTLSVAQTVLPSSVPESGGQMTVSFTITNNSLESVTLAAFSTTPFGDVTNPNNQSITNTNCALVTIPGSGNYTCSVTANFSGQPGEYNLITSATGEDNEGNEASAGAESTMSVTNLASSINVVLTASPVSVPAPGGPANFTVTVTNTSLSDSVKIDSLTDQLLGSLDGQGSCNVPTEWIESGGVYQCAFTAMVSGEAGENVINQVTISGEDDDGDLVSGNSTVPTVAIDGNMIFIFLPYISSSS